MENLDQDIWNIIVTILNGSETPQDQEKFKSWINEHPTHQTYFDLLKSEWEKDYLLTTQTSEKIYLNLTHKMKQVNNSRKYIIMRYAAVAVFALLIGVSIPWIFNTRISEYKVTYLASTTHLGVKTKIILPDSSVVFLNSGSTLEYPDRFVSNERLVKLKGEAYFEVHKDKDHPFKVFANGITIKVLGTHFNVKAYPDDDKILTSLLEGSVSLQKESKGYDTTIHLLFPNQQAVFQKTNGRINISQVNANMYMVWTKGQFYFEHQDFQEIARQLEREFNVHIQIQTNRLRREVFTGNFKKGENLYTILDVMKNHRGFDYRDIKGGLEIFETP